MDDWLIFFSSPYFFSRVATRPLQGEGQFGCGSVLQFLHISTREGLRQLLLTSAAETAEVHNFRRVLGFFCPVNTFSSCKTSLRALCRILVISFNLPRQQLTRDLIHLQTVLQSHVSQLSSACGLCTAVSVELMISHHSQSIYRPELFLFLSA